MSDLSMRSSGDEIAELRNEVKKLRSLAQAAPEARSSKRSWRRPIALVGIAVLTVGMLAGVAGASGTTTNVTFVALSPAKVILSNAAIATHKTSSPVVIGGTTTVPSNATTVELSVTVKGPSIGTLQFYPALNPSGGSGQTVSYPGSNVANTATIQENVGQAGELTIYNNGIGTATVTAKILGYSRQVTAGDINGVGGTVGQLLTDDGAGGASWQAPPRTTSSGIDGTGGASGQVLTNNGIGGAAWHSPAGIVSVLSIVGYSGNFPGSASTYTMGASAIVAVVAGQTVQTNVSAALGSSAPSTVTFNEESCYLAPGATSPTLFTPGGYMTVTTVVGAREIYSSSGTFVASVSGSYRVGLCVEDFSASPLDNSDWTNGTVSVFNPSS